MGKKKVLVIGLGSIGLRHTRILSEQNDTVVSVCDSDARRLRDSNNFKVSGKFASYEEALAQKPDMVFVCTPNNLHAQMTIDAVRAGADVFCEKPISDNLSDATSILEEQRKMDKFVAVGYLLRFEPGVMAIKNIVTEGRLGQILCGEAYVGAYDTLLRAKSDYRYIERGALVHDYTHEIDYVRWIVGEVEEVVATAGTLGKFDKVVDPNFVKSILKFSSGAIIGLSFDYIRHPNLRRIELMGEKGTLGYVFGSGQIIFQMRGEKSSEYIEIEKYQVDDLFRCQDGAFIDAGAQRMMQMVRGRNATETLAVAEALIEAYEKKSWVHVEDKFA